MDVNLRYLLVLYSRSPKSHGGYLHLVKELARNVSRLYPGWRMRIYHNVTWVGVGPWHLSSDMCVSKRILFRRTTARP